MKKYKNKKTNKIYYLIRDDIINATNMQEGQIMVSYQKCNKNGFPEGIFFVREKREFFEKFEAIE